MTTSIVPTETATTKNVRVTDRALVVELRDGRVVSVPLACIRGWPKGRQVSDGGGNYWGRVSAFTGRTSTKTFRSLVFFKGYHHRRHSCVACIVIGVALPVAVQQIAPPLAIAKQGSFFIGGRDVSSEALTPPTRPFFLPTVTVLEQAVQHALHPTPAGAIASGRGCWPLRG